MKSENLIAVTYKVIEFQYLLMLSIVIKNINKTLSLKNANLHGKKYSENKTNANNVI